MRDHESIFPAMCNSNDFSLQQTVRIFLSSSSLLVGYCGGNMFSEGTRFESAVD